LPTIKTGKLKLIFEKQLLHYFLLAVLLTGVYIASRIEGFLSGSFLSISTPVWLYSAIAIAVVHQVYVWFCWRMQLHFSLITNKYGHKGFIYYSIGFMVLFVLRFVVVVMLAISNMNTMNAGQLLVNIPATIIAIPVVYLLYSVIRYFTIERALGIDHFDLSYGKKPFVKKGIFKYTDNGMYFFGLLVFWIPGLLCSSQAALLMALFNHIYVWVHYYTTEKPDFKIIYSLPSGS
jgi:hypothetical protein